MAVHFVIQAINIVFVVFLFQTQSNTTHLPPNFYYLITPKKYENVIYYVPIKTVMLINCVFIHSHIYDSFVIGK